MDRLTELELLVQIADVGSLSGAALKLGLSNPAATRYLAALETRLNARLVERNTRRLHLTSEGKALCERARLILIELQDAEAAVNSSTLNPTGVLRVSASLSFAMQMIAPRLRKYHELYPNVRIHLETANRYLDMIENDIDVAIRTREFEPDSNITIRSLAKTRRVLTASPGYLSVKGAPKSPSDLSRHDLLLYVHANNPNSLHFTRGTAKETMTVQGLLESNDGQVLRAAALDGLGILVQPSYIVFDDVVAGRLVPVLDDWDLPQLQINIAFASRRHLSAKVRTFIDFMVAEFDQYEFERKWTSYLGLQSAKTFRRVLE